jgi:hypothetical protein
VADNYLCILFLRLNNSVSNTWAIDYFLLSFYLYFFLSRLFILPGCDVLGNVCCGINGGR